MVEYSGGLLCVCDIQRSRQLYEGLLEQKMLEDFGENIVYEGFSLQEKACWASFLGVDSERITTGRFDHEVYFETSDLDAFLLQMNKYEVTVLHVQESNWHQRCVRFLDYDGHLIEVGESMDALMLKYLAEGHSIEETHARYQYSVAYIKQLWEMQKV